MDIHQKLTQMQPTNRTNGIFKHFQAYIFTLLKEAECGILSPQSMKSIFYRLKKPVEESVITGDPTDLLTYLNAYLSQMSILATYSDVTTFVEWCIHTKRMDGPNQYEIYRKRHRRKSFFKGHGTPRKDLPSLATAEALIATLKSPKVKRKALELLVTGMRWRESLTLKDGVVLGKGLKPRKISLPAIPGPPWVGHYDSFRKALAKIGLKPHDLRKIYATHLAKVLRLNAYEIQAKLGHASILTSQAYVNIGEG